MRVIKYFLILTIAILGFSFVDVSAQNSSDRNTQSVQNIERKIFKQLINMSYYGVFDHISYKVDGSTVTLYGKVVNGFNKRNAENIVEDIDGVSRVVNQIEVLPASPFDNSIRYEMLRTFATRGGSLYRYIQEPRPSIRIIVDGGRVTLEGVVNNRSDANLANILANGVSGVFSVTNNLQIERENR